MPISKPLSPPAPKRSEDPHAVADRVTREDLVLFINACFSCTGQAEF